MFRVYVPIFSVLLALAVLLPVSPADAGQRGYRNGGHHGAIHLYSGRRTHYAVGPRHIRRHNRSIRFARDGWRSDGRHFERRNSSLRYSRHHVPTRRYFTGSGSLVIVVGNSATSDTAGSGTTGSSDIYLENGSCAAGEYCTLRLGPYASSPKIITLNTSGKTITDPNL